ncbi:MAG: hypothetical protein HYW63_04135 [Candidatus Levybacteria bacterium]|nr:hypothetical protein [Candidatus Levybacteria bacterium]
MVVAETRIGNGRTGMVPPAPGIDSGDPPVLSPEQINAWTIVERATSRQEELIRAGRFEGFREAGRKAFIPSFLGDPEFSEAYSRAQTGAMTEEDDSAYSSRLMELMFKRMAYLYLGAKSDLGIVLTGMDALEVRRAFHPEAEVTSNWHSEGLQDLHVPHGLLVSRIRDVPVVTGILKYSLDGNGPDHEQLTGAATFRDELGLIGRDPKFINVSPIYKNQRGHPHRTNGFYGQPITLPIAAGRLRYDLEPFIYREYKQPGEATLAERRATLNVANGPQPEGGEDTQLGLAVLIKDPRPNTRDTHSVNYVAKEEEDEMIRRLADCGTTLAMKLDLQDILRRLREPGIALAFSSAILHSISVRAGERNLKLRRLDPRDIQDLPLRDGESARSRIIYAVSGGLVYVEGVYPTHEEFDKRTGNSYRRGSN